MNQTEIQEALRKHRLWLYGKEEGVCADFTSSYIVCANFENAILTYISFMGSNLQGCNFKNADLRFTNLIGANLRDADITNTKFSPYLICPQSGSFQAFKKTTAGIIKVLIPARANRLNAITSRKIRVSEFKVLSGPGCGGTGTHYPGKPYLKGQTYKAPGFNDDVRLECAEGLHVFLTEQEAEEW